MSATEIVLIVGAVGSAICSIIAAWKANSAQNQSVQNSQALQRTEQKLATNTEVTISTASKVEDIHKGIS